MGVATPHSECEAGPRKPQRTRTGGGPRGCAAHLRMADPWHASLCGSPTRKSTAVLPARWVLSKAVCWLLFSGPAGLIFLPWPLPVSSEVGGPQQSSSFITQCPRVESGSATGWCPDGLPSGCRNALSTPSPAKLNREGGRNGQDQKAGGESQARLILVPFPGTPLLSDPSAGHDHESVRGSGWPRMCCDSRDSQEDEAYPSLGLSTKAELS